MSKLGTQKEYISLFTKSLQLEKIVNHQKNKAEFKAAVIL